MKKTLVSITLLSIIILGTVARIKLPDAGIYPPIIPVETACILAHSR